MFSRSMRRRYVFLAMLGLSLQSCVSAGPAAPPTIAGAPSPAMLPPVHTATALAVPSRVPTDTITPRPMALNPEGPWLVSLVDDRVYVMDTDGSGMAALNVPGLWLPYEDILTSGFEPTGMLALRTYAGDRPPADLALAVFNLPSLQPARSVPLLSQERRAEIDGWTATTGWWEDDDLLALDLDGFWPTLMWSPDGRYLAFVGLLDGPSADVYAYDSQTGTVRRLTDGPRQPILMGWSPDSRWVIHLEAEDLQMADGLHFTPIAVWAADVGGGPAKELYQAKRNYGNSERIVGWRSSSAMVASEVDIFGISRDLKTVDVNTGEYRVIFDEHVFEAAVDPVSGTIAFLPEAVIFPRGSAPAAHGLSALTFPPRQGDVEGGIYLVAAGRDDVSRLDFPDWEYVYGHLRWLPEIQRFVASGMQTVLFSSAGDIGERLEEGDLPLASPDGAWLLFGVDRWGNPGGSLRLYTAQGDFVANLIDGPGWHPQWAPDSAGVYYLQRPDGAWEWRFSTVPDGDTTLLEKQEGDNALMRLADPRP